MLPSRHACPCGLRVPSPHGHRSCQKHTQQSSNQDGLRDAVAALKKRGRENQGKPTTDITG